LRNNNRYNNKIKGSALIASIFFIVILLGSEYATATSSNIVPKIMWIEVDKAVADVLEPIIFTIYLESFSGPVDYFILIPHDGSPPITSTGNIIQHSFLYEGEYLVSIVAVSKCGLTNLKTASVRILNNKPYAEIDIPEYAYENETVQIKAINVVDDEFDIDNLKFRWTLDTGNGQVIKNGTEISYSWSNSGNMPITLTVMDDQMALSTDTEFIEIKNKAPIANFSIEPKKIVLEDQQITVNASLSYDTPNDMDSLQYYWDFGDGTFDTGSALDHIYRESGNYTITLYVLDNDGAIGNISKNITVMNIPPNISVKEDLVYLNEGESYTFRAESFDTETDYTRLKYNWSFGAEGWTATYTALDDGIQNITVLVEDPEGCTDYDNVSVVISNIPPSVSVFQAYVAVNLSLRAWGTPNNSFYLKIIEHNENGDYIIGYSVVNVMKYCQINKSEPVPVILDLAKNYTIEINYTDYSTVSGINTVELVFNFSHGQSYSMFHIFKSSYSCCCCPWSVDPKSWLIDPSDHLFNMPITFNGTVFDPGYDNISINGTFRVHLLFSLSSSFYWLFPFLFFYNNIYYYWYEVDNNTWLELRAWYDKNYNLFYFMIDIYHKVLQLQNLTKKPYDCNTPFIATVRPIDLSFLKVFDCPIFNNSLFTLSVLEAINLLEIEVMDDDGGLDRTIVNITTKDGKLHIIDMAPVVSLPRMVAMEDSPIGFFIAPEDYYKDLSENLSVLWRFGDNLISNESFYIRNFSNSGKYLVEIEVFDGIYSTKRGYFIEIQNKIPKVEFYIPENITEDYQLDLKAWSYDTASDINSLRIWWNLDDGTLGIGTELKHKWSYAGNYTLKVYVSDNNGAWSFCNKVLEIINNPPKIEGPNGLEAVEGSILYLDIKVSDSPYDELHLYYSWEFDNLFIEGRKPSLYLDNGKYYCILNVSDPDGLKSVLNISIDILNIIPVVIPAPQVYYGNVDKVNLKAYALDSFVDLEDLRFEWYLNDTPVHDGRGTFSSVEWTPEHSGDYDVVVSVYDDYNRSKSYNFKIIVSFDNDGDGIMNELETVYDISPDKADTDNDCLTDWYELYVYYTSPLSPDTDNDGLPDGCGYMLNATGQNIKTGELILGTDPLCNDTDHDNLTDGFEVIGWIINIKFINDMEETRPVSSDPLILDTDGDELNDYLEYIFGTDPRDWDTDDDGDSDWDEYISEVLGNITDSDGDGLMDSEEDESYTVVLADGTKIQTYSNKTMKDSDNDQLDDWEERHPGKDGYITDAMNNDTDGDGIIDSAEGYGRVEEYGKREKIEANKWNIFSFYTEIGRGVINASITVTISVGESIDEEGSGPANIQIKVYAHGNDLLYTNSTDNKRYYCNKTDITSLMKEKGTYSGYWKLEVYSNQDCLLEEFKLEVSLRLSPLDPDCDDDGIDDHEELTPGLDGWITNPSSPDSDADGWSDYYEILTSFTSPLSKDTDGDGVLDPDDIDPLKNLILRLTPRYGHDESVWLQPNYMCMVLKVNGENGIITPYRKTTKDSRTRGIFIRWSVYTTAEFKNPETGQFLKYYVDIPDSKDESVVKIESRLWSGFLYPWVLKVNAIRDYKVKGITEMTKIFRAHMGSNWLEYGIDIIGLERVNTIAVYQNGSFYNDHYPSIEMVNLIILDINGENNIFKNGINVIVLPVSLFVNTKLHALIEQTVDEAGNFDPNKLPSYLNDAEFSGIDRGSETVSRHIESTITKEDVQIEEAMKILELCMTSANESEGIIYLNKSVRAGLLGLAEDVLKMIPFDGKIMQSDRQGLIPAGELLYQIITDPSKLWKMLNEVLVAIVNFITNLINAIIEFGLWLIGLFSQAMQAIEAAVKAIIMVFAIILLALELISETFIWLIFGGIILPIFSLILPGTLLWIPLFGFSYESEDKKTNIYYEEGISWYYFSILDMKLPILYRKLYRNSKLISVEKKSIIPFLEIEDNTNPENDYENFQENYNDFGKSGTVSDIFLNLTKEGTNTIAYSDISIHPLFTLPNTQINITIYNVTSQNGTINQIIVEIGGISKNLTQIDKSNTWTCQFEIPENFEGEYEVKIKIKNSQKEWLNISNIYINIISENEQEAILNDLAAGFSLALSIGSIIFSLLSIAASIKSEPYKNIFTKIAIALTLILIGLAPFCIIQSIYLNYYKFIIEEPQILNPIWSFILITFLRGFYFIGFIVGVILLIITFGLISKLGSIRSDPSEFLQILSLTWTIGGLVESILHLYPNFIFGPGIIDNILGRWVALISLVLFIGTAILFFYTGITDNMILNWLDKIVKILIGVLIITFIFVWVIYAVGILIAILIVFLAILFGLVGGSIQ